MEADDICPTSILELSSLQWAFLCPPLPALSTIASELLVLVVALLVALGRVAVVLPIVGCVAIVARALLLAFAFSFSLGEALAFSLRLP